LDLLKDKQVICGDYVYAIFNGVLCRWLSTEQAKGVGREKVPEQEYSLLPHSVRELLLTPSL
jgi:hypothetical protein